MIKIIGPILAVILSALLLLLAFNESETPPIVQFLILSQACLLVYLALLEYYRRTPGRLNGRTWKFMIVLAIILRLGVAFGAGEQSYLSDDVYRYVWEGKLVVNGINPFLHSPREMSETALVDSTIYPNINHPDLPTIYPPLSQILFAAAYKIGGDSIIGFKILAMIFELLSIVSILLLVREFRLPRWSALIYLFSPMIVIEFIFSNHLDIFGLPFLILSIVALNRREAWLAGGMLALAVVIKLMALIFVPVFILYFAGRRRWQFLTAFAAVCFLSYLPFTITAGTDVFGSLWTYLGNWQYNASTFMLLAKVFNAPSARIICLALLTASSATILFSPRLRTEPIRQMFYLFGAYLILTPSLFPWYMIWIMPFLVIFQNRPFLILTGTVMLAYHVLIGYYAEGVWSEYPWLRVAEYLPFYGLLLFELWRVYSKKETRLL